MDNDSRIVRNWLVSIGRPGTKIPEEVIQAIYDHEMKRRRFPILTWFKSNYTNDNPRQRSRQKENESEYRDPWSKISQYLDEAYGKESSDKP